MFRKLANALLLNSPYYFEDGSRISYLAQFDILRYRTGGGNPKFLDIGLESNRDTGLMRLETMQSWKWRDPSVPLTENSETGIALTAQEKSNVVNKLREFIEKHPKKYERI